MDRKSLYRLHHATALVAVSAFVFYLFFQINKTGPFRELNPFGEDPYDAIGSFAIQIAVLVGVLSYARMLHILMEPHQVGRLCLVLRGNLLVLAAILITLVADAAAIWLHPLPPTYWGGVLRVELGGMFGLLIACSLALAVAFWRVPTAAPPRDLTPADAIDDLWTLVRLPVVKIRSVLPRSLVAWVESFNSDWLFHRLPWLDPRLHPWRFALFLGLAVGAGLVLAQLQEGLPPSLQIGLLVMGIFISAELAATLLGFAFLGGYLGLRPALGHRSI